MMNTIIIAVAVGLVFGCGLAWLLWNRLSKEKDAALKESLRGIVAEVTNVTNASLKEREAELSARNGKDISSMLEPMRQQLESFRKAADESKKTNGELGVRMQDFFTILQTTAGEFGKQAKSFTDAMSGANKKQGNWGELILRQMLEDCGLREGVNFDVQAGSGNGIPDVQLYDPIGKRILVIDSKMSWTKYEEAYHMEDGPERKEALREHVNSVKRHIDELKAANYPETQKPLRPGYTFIPLTAMFVPCDAALSIAISEDPALVKYAFDNGVALVSPVSLFGFMQLVHHAWVKYNADKKSEEITKQAGYLIERLDMFCADFEEIGSCLDKSLEKYDNMKRLLSNDGKSIGTSVRKILKCGAKPAKIKSEFIKDAVAENENTATNAGAGVEQT